MKVHNVIYPTRVETTTHVFNMAHQLSISGADVCSDCARCTYRPGDLSDCTRRWPAEFHRDGYAVSCISFFRRHETVLQGLTAKTEGPK